MATRNGELASTITFPAFQGSKGRFTGADADFASFETCAEEINLTQAIAVRENVLRLVFSMLVYFTGLLDPGDASLPGNFSVAPIAGTTDSQSDPTHPVSVVRVQMPTANVDGIDPALEGFALDLILDRPMSAYPSAYNVHIETVYDIGILAGFTGDSGPIPALFRKIVPPQIDVARPSRDIANPQTLRGALAAGASLVDAEASLGHLRTDDTGDYAFDQGPENLRKRLIRRAITKKNAYGHLPGYGLGLLELGKKLLVAANLAAVQADAEVQFKQEPDVANVKVTIRIDSRNPNLVRFAVFAQQKTGAPINFELPVDVT